MIVVASGWPLETYGDKVGVAHKAEVLNSDGTRLCSLPDLPDKHKTSYNIDKRYLASMAGGMICGGYGSKNSNIETTCIKFQHGKWIELPWKLREGFNSKKSGTFQI